MSIIKTLVKPSLIFIIVLAVGLGLSLSLSGNGSYPEIILSSDNDLDAHLRLARKLDDKTDGVVDSSPQSSLPVFYSQDDDVCKREDNDDSPTICFPLCSMRIIRKEGTEHIFKIAHPSMRCSIFHFNVRSICLLNSISGLLCVNNHFHDKQFILALNQSHDFFIDQDVDYCLLPTRSPPA
jgi:hypothetical protein